jgi:hypothetical protein
VRVGISRGWADQNWWTSVGQYIDVTDLADGRYRLRASADDANWFTESDETNNYTWVDIRIKGKSVTLLGYGPSVSRIA